MRLCVQRRTGFTMVELMVVLAIVSVLATLGVTRMTRRNRYTACAGLAREIYALANQARMTTLAGRKQVWLRVQNTNPAAQLRVARLPGTGWFASDSDWQPPESLVNGQQGCVITGVAVGAQMNTNPGTMYRDIIFYPDGMVEIAQNPRNPNKGATIYISDPQAAYPQRVMLYGRTGFAKVVDR